MVSRGGRGGSGEVERRDAIGGRRQKSEGAGEKKK